MRQLIKKNINMAVMVLSLLCITIIFTLLTKGIFVYPRNIALLARQMTVVGVLSLGMMFVIIAGHIDLSVGSIVGLTGVVAAILQVWFDWGTVPVIIVTILVGILCGAWHGYWIAYRDVPAFIITLGGLLAFKGVKLGLSKSTSIAPMNSDFSFLGQSYLSVEISWIIAFISILLLIVKFKVSRNSRLKYGLSIKNFKMDLMQLLVMIALIIGAFLYLNAYKGLPTPVLIMLLLAVVFSFLGDKTIFGRNIYALGGNFQAARLSGINTSWTTMLVFLMSGGLSAIAGIILTARLDASTPAAGDGLELDAIAACVIGGASMKGGIGRVVGVILGALVMASLDNGMSLINLENYWQFIVKGLVLTFAVWVDSASKKTV